jgi:ubiquitin carboxyl-terminal hydrolase 7
MHIVQGTKAEGAIAKLFVGKMKSFIKCVNVDYESSRIEEFNGADVLIVSRN